MTVATVVLAAVYATLRTSLSAWEKAETLGEEAQTARAVIELVSRDLRAAVPPPRGDSHYLTFIGRDATVDDRDADALEFGVLSATSPRELDRVRYWLEAGLARQTSRAWGADHALEKADNALETGDAGGLTDSGTVPGGTTDSLVTPLVKAMNFRYFDGSEWSDFWDSGVTGVLPKQVEITIRVGVENNQDLWKTYRTVVVLPTARGGDVRTPAVVAGGIQ